MRDRYMCLRCGEVQDAEDPEMFMCNTCDYEKCGIWNFQKEKEKEEMEEHG